MTNLNGPGFGFGFLAFIALVWGLACTIIWIVIGWRAMRAHEKIADAAEIASRQTLVPPTR